MKAFLTVNLSSVVVVMVVVVVVVEQQQLLQFLGSNIRKTSETIQM
jgi:hypothetical protein